MRRNIFYFLLLVPIVVWAAVTEITSSGNWNDSGIWFGGNIADNITEDADMDNNIGIVIIQNGDSYTISDLDMNNGNTLTIDAGGSLTIGSMADNRNLTSGNITTLNIDGNLEIWGNLDVNNDLILNVTGTVIIHGDLILGNDASIDIQGGVTIEGILNGGNNADINVDGILDITGDIIMGSSSNLTGSGTVNLGGGCTGPASFCDGSPLEDIPPVISNCPTDISISLSGADCDESVNWTEPTASDNTAFESFTSTHTPGIDFPVGTTTVTYTATDISGNSSTCSFNVTVNDVTPPVISNCPADIVVSISGSGCDESVTWTPPTTADNCIIDTFTSMSSPGDTFPIGITAVTYTATDASGNSSTCSFTVTVNDDTPPVISNCPADIVVSISGSGCDEAVTWTAPTTADNCSIDTFTSTHNPGDIFPIGTTTVTYTATDLSGNSSTCSFIVTIEDRISPLFDFCPTAVNISEFDLYTQRAVVTWQTPVASDNCGSSIITSNHNSGDSFPPELTKVIYTATDESGNVTTCELEIEIEGNALPIASPVFVDVFAGEPVEVCLDVTDPDGDDLVISEIKYNTLNGEIVRTDNSNNFCLTYTSFNDFEGEDLFYVRICDDGTPVACIDVEVRVRVTINLTLTIYKAFTPDGDNINDVWTIENIDNYPDNRVMIFDRWGGLIFSARGYNNESVVWDGRSNQSGQHNVPSGTYFYKIDLGEGYPSQKGFVELIQ